MTARRWCFPLHRIRVDSVRVLRRRDESRRYGPLRIETAMLHDGLAVSRFKDINPIRPAFP